MYTLSYTTLFRSIKATDFQKLLTKYPTISLKVLEEFSSRLASSELQTTRVATESVETRLAHFIAEMADQTEGEIKTITHPLSKKDVAASPDTEPETRRRSL